MIGWLAAKQEWHVRMLIYSPIYELCCPTKMLQQDLHFFQRLKKIVLEEKYFLMSSFKLLFFSFVCGKQEEEEEE